MIHLPCYSCISAFMYEQLHWLPLSARIEFKILILVSRAQRGLAPTFLAGVIYKLLLWPLQPPYIVHSDLQTGVIVFFLHWNSHDLFLVLCHYWSLSFKYAVSIYSFLYSSCSFLSLNQHTSFLFF